ncbi:MAG: hypothetical protein AVDCRST_MAG01-01-195, partial [uncultured Rubrobacteraceae bacterium]
EGLRRRMVLVRLCQRAADLRRRRGRGLGAPHRRVRHLLALARDRSHRRHHRLLLRARGAGSAADRRRARGEPEELQAASRGHRHPLAGFEDRPGPCGPHREHLAAVRVLLLYAVRLRGGHRGGSLRRLHERGAVLGARLPSLRRQHRRQPVLRDSRRLLRLASDGDLLRLHRLRGSDAALVLRLAAHGELRRHGSAR